MCGVLLSACAGSGDKIDVAIPAAQSAAAPAASSSAGPRIAVVPFEDKRPDQRYVGQREDFWGGSSYFYLPGGTLSTACANALVEYLNRHGWRASLARTAGGDGVDVSILGTVLALSLDAKGRAFRTQLSAKNQLGLQIINHGEGSVVRERISGSATDQVFWFTPNDAQELVTDLLESNFRKFMTDVRIEGRAIHLR
jgi:hypothetical protein